MRSQEEIEREMMSLMDSTPHIIPGIHDITNCPSCRMTNAAIAALAWALSGPDSGFILLEELSLPPHADATKSLSRN